LAFLTTALAELLSHDQSVQFQDLIGQDVADGPPEGGGALHVGHHDREPLGRAADIGHGAASCDEPAARLRRALSILLRGS
jgi:hypothetical protein